MGAQASTAANAIEIRIEDIAQLFHNLDPLSVPKKGSRQRCGGIHRQLGERAAYGSATRKRCASAGGAGIHAEAYELGHPVFWLSRPNHCTRSELFRVGRRGLAIGLTVLSFSVITSQTIAASLTSRPIGRVGARVDIKPGGRLALSCHYDKLSIRVDSAARAQR
jgi:hypothetical protein